mmetsp:Transcript_16656/g.36255  ORF Transcript_16656/g.36255 Transcript_16656/m.36255 type:complete len:210 (+) Transcript_16656:135-764(+)
MFPMLSRFSRQDISGQMSRIGSAHIVVLCRSYCRCRCRLIIRIIFLIINIIVVVITSSPSPLLLFLRRPTTTQPKRSQFAFAFAFAFLFSSSSSSAERVNQNNWTELRIVHMPRNVRLGVGTVRVDNALRKLLTRKHLVDTSACIIVIIIPLTVICAVIIIIPEKGQGIQQQPTQYRRNVRRWSYRIHHVVHVVISEAKLSHRTMLRRW